MKIERKISFTVAGIEFQNLKTAQFFKRAVELETQGLSSDAKSKFDADGELLDTWYSMLSYSRGMVDPETVVSTVLSLQLPKPDDTEFEMIPDNSMPGIYGKDDTIG